MRRQPNRAAAVGGRGPKVAGVSESDAVAVNVRETQQLCLRCRGCRSDQGNKKGKEDADRYNSFKQGLSPLSSV